jgi:hypothetical protein
VPSNNQVCVLGTGGVGLPYTNLSSAYPITSVTVGGRNLQLALRLNF